MLSGEPYDKYAATYRTHFPESLDMGEIADAVDHFYVDAPENAPLPVSDAINYVALKAGGAPSSVLDRFVAERRKHAAETR